MIPYCKQFCPLFESLNILFPSNFLFFSEVFVPVGVTVGDHHLIKILVLEIYQSLNENSKLLHLIIQPVILLSLIFYNSYVAYYSLRNY